MTYRAHCEGHRTQKAWRDVFALPPAMPPRTEMRWEMTVVHTTEDS